MKINGTSEGGGLTPEELQKLDVILNPKKGIPEYMGIGVESMSILDVMCSYMGTSFNLYEYDKQYFTRLYNVGGLTIYKDVKDGRLYSFIFNIYTGFGFNSLYDDYMPETIIGNPGNIWMDNNYNMYCGLTNIRTGESITFSDGEEYYYVSSGKHNIYKTPDNRFILIGVKNRTNTPDFILDKETMQFVPITITYNGNSKTSIKSTTAIGTMITEFNGDIVYVYGNTRFILRWYGDNDYRWDVISKGDNTSCFPAMIDRFNGTSTRVNGKVVKRVGDDYYYILSDTISKLENTAGEWKWGTSKYVGIDNATIYGVSFYQEQSTGVYKGFIGMTSSGFGLINVGDKPINDKWGVASLADYATKAYVDSKLGEIETITNKILA